MSSKSNCDGLRTPNDKRPTTIVQNSLPTSFYSVFSETEQKLCKFAFPQYATLAHLTKHVSPTTTSLVTPDPTPTVTPPGSPTVTWTAFVTSDPAPTVTPSGSPTVTWTASPHECPKKAYHVVSTDPTSELRISRKNLTHHEISTKPTLTTLEKKFFLSKTKTQSTQETT